MPSSNDPAAWQNFFLMMGTANATLTGLLFVALSIHLREVRRERLTSGTPRREHGPPTSGASRVLTRHETRLDTTPILTI